MLNFNGYKPKGMHWETFWRLKAKHNAFVKVGLAGMMAKLKSLEIKILS